MNPFKSSLLSWHGSDVYQLNPVIEVVHYKDCNQLQNDVVQEYHDGSDNIYS